MQSPEKSIALIALFAALTAALGLIPQYTMPWGVPITAQSLGVMLAGAVLGARRGALSMLLFILLVALGLPLLAGGRGGLGVFASPTAGFVIGFPFAAFATGFVMQQLKGPIVVSAIVAAILGGIVVLYAFGMAGFYLLTDKTLFAAIGILWVYIPGDLIKVVLTGLILRGLYHARPGAIFTRQ